MVITCRRAIVMQQKTQRPVQFEITAQTRASVEAWIRTARRHNDDFLSPSHACRSAHISTRQYARKAALIFRRTKNLRAVQLLLGQTKLESTARYWDIEVDAALEMAEQTEV